MTTTSDELIDKLTELKDFCAEHGDTETWVLFSELLDTLQNGSRLFGDDFVKLRTFRLTATEILNRVLAGTVESVTDAELNRLVKASFVKAQTVNRFLKF